MKLRRTTIYFLSLIAGLSVSAQSVLSNQSAAADMEEQVFIHYLAWYGEGSDGNHWADGTAQEPIVGFYNSQSWSTHLYHILLSSAVGVDGLVVNVRTDYDEVSLKKVLPSLQRIVDIDADFDYKLAVSYDDQDMTLESVKSELEVLKSDIIGGTSQYLHLNEEPVIFIWNYDGFLTSEEYREAVTATFPDNSPVLLRNEIDFNTTEDAIDSYYPWVQGFDEKGENWGEGYLDWYYRTLQIREDIEFATAGAWPGFDDRSASWGQNRWIDRKEGETFQQTWDLIHKYQTESAIKWVILETWNDWNEGTEIEPSKEHGFTYVTKTAENIGTFKGESYPVNDTLFSASTKIYLAAQMIESGERDSAEFYPYFEDAVASFIEKDPLSTIATLEEIFNPTVALTTQALSADINVYPNPSSGVVNILVPQKEVNVSIHDASGKIIYTQSVDGEVDNAIQWDAKSRKGFFFIEISEGEESIVKRVLIK
ncbi:MAG: T9SS type A sorting domain-containing protein [Cyclobacteriaceae bacterium]